MPAMLVDEGRLDLLAIYLATLGGNLKVGLFKAPATPVQGTVWGGITQATFTGYAEVAPAWGAGAINGNDNAQSGGATCVFSVTVGGAAQTILGYYVRNALTNALVFIELFSAPIVMQFAGNQITVTPNLYGGIITPPL